MPEKIDPRTCLASLSAVALMDKSLIKSCKKLHLSGFVCHKTYAVEFAAAVVEHRVLTLLNAIAAGCLDKNSDIRFQSMEESHYVSEAVLCVLADWDVVIFHIRQFLVKTVLP